MNAIYTTDNMSPPFSKGEPRAFYAGQVVPVSVGSAEIKDKEMNGQKHFFHSNQTKEGMKNED